MESITRYLADPAAATALGRTIAFLALATLAVVVFVIGAVPVRRMARQLVTRSKSSWDDMLLSDGMLRALAWLPPLWLLHQGCAVVLAGLGRGARFADRLLLAIVTAVLLRVATHGLDAVERIYRRYTVSRAHPIKAFVQLGTLLLYAVGLVVIVALLLDRPAWGFLSGIGALSAVLMLVFKDSLLGLAASFQLSSNHLVHVGDWIEMPKYNADGDVIDISLLTVKVKNWDHSITAIPIYALASDSFRNWRGMSESGGRRIMRSIFIDLRSIRFCDEELLARFRHIHFLAVLPEFGLRAYQSPSGWDVGEVGRVLDRP